MTFQSQGLITRPTFLEGLWMMNAAPGATTEPDLSGKGRNLTYSVAKVDGEEIIVSGGNGMLSSSTLWATIAVATGSGLAPTAAATLVGWVKPTTFKTVGVFGRQNHLRAFIQPSGSVSGFAWGTANTDLRMSQWATAGTAYMLAVVFTGQSLQVYVNGVMVQETARANALAAVADGFFVGANVNGMDGTIAGVGVWSTALGQGELEELYRQGTKTSTWQQAFGRNRLYDALPVVAAAPLAVGGGCAVCGGDRAVNEGVVDMPNGAKVHPGCCGAKALNKPLVAPTATSVAADYEKPLLQLTEVYMRTMLSRVPTLTTKPTYFDGVRIQPTATSPITTANWDQYLPFAATGALVAHLRKLPAESWQVQFAINQFEHMLAIQTTQGDFRENTWVANYNGGADFVVGQMGEIMLYLRRHVTEATYARWFAAYVALGNSFVTYPVSQPESAFYVNGNREASELWGYWMLWLVTGDAKWRTQYETQLTYLSTYGIKTNAQADTESNRNYGWFTVTTPTQADGSDGEGYFIERTGTKVGSVVGPGTDGATGSAGSAVLNGFDPNYTAYCNTYLARLWLYNRDPRILRYLNMSFNLLARYANLSASAVNGVAAWSLDGRLGSRQAVVLTYGTCTFAVLGFLGGRAGVTLAQINSSYAEILRFYLSDQINVANIQRGINSEVGTLLMTLPSWDYSVLRGTY